ncbi:MAG: hypothetical protein J6Q54_04135, partial [Oscillospiraceae bacterium]|nr:hypothetical protein [Oscillospiraceae bacterium]
GGKAEKGTYMLNFQGISPDWVNRLNRKYSLTNKVVYFDLFPKTIPAGETSKIYIKSKSSAITLEGTYFVHVFPYYEYDYQPFRTNIEDYLTVEAEDGSLCFDYHFPTEQMYVITVGQLVEGELHLLLRSSVYALEADLYNLKPLIGDLHCHTIHSDGIEPPDMLLDAAIGHGLDFIAITDHNSYDGSAVAQQIAESKNLPITVLNGEEYSCSFTNMHIISRGAPGHLSGEHYLYPGGEDMLRISVAEQTRTLCEKIRANGGVSIMCHPLWKPMRRDRVRMDVPQSLVKELMGMDIFDAIEVVGGSPINDAMTGIMQYNWAVSYGATPDKVAYVGSTDSHTYTVDRICGKHFTLVLATENTQEAILEAIRQKRTVAIQVLDQENAYCLGTPRLSMYAQFYLSEIAHRIYRIL